MKLIKILLSLCLLIALVGCNTTLPKPEVSEGVRGDLGIDKNINEETIDNYLNRSDSVYRDVRMLVDNAAYEVIGGNSVTDGIVKGFEIVPYPYLCNVTNLPEEVGDSYTGNTLFTKTEGGYINNYDESLRLLENLFPKNKNIFIMCGGGGYAGMTKDLLTYYGWDADKIYNVGGYWYYNGENKIDIKKEENGETYYDMSQIKYHNIDFNSLTPREDYVVNKEITNTLSFTEIDENSLDAINSMDYSLIFVYLRGCSACSAFKTIINDVKLYNDLNIYEIEFNKLSLLNLDLLELKYAPSLIILNNGEVIDYLDSSKDEDKEYYKTAVSLSKWLSQYMSINIVETGNINNEECSDITCQIQ